LAEALAVRPRVLEQTRLFVAGLFLTFNAKFEFPRENCSEDERADIHEQLACDASDMLTFVTAPVAAPSQPHEKEPLPTAIGNWRRHRGV
jgi:hypothetical protein